MDREVRSDSNRRGGGAKALAGTGVRGLHKPDNRLTGWPVVLFAALQLLSVKSNGQSLEQLRQLLEFADSSARSFVQEKQEVIVKAYERNIPVVKQLPNGGMMELMSFEGDRPVYVGTDTSNESDTLHAKRDEVKSGTNVPSGLVFEHNVLKGQDSLKEPAPLVEISKGTQSGQFHLDFGSHPPRFVAAVKISTGLVVYTANDIPDLMDVDLSKSGKGEYRLMFFYEKRLTNRIVTIE